MKRERDELDPMVDDTTREESDDLMASLYEPDAIEAIIEQVPTFVIAVFLRSRRRLIESGAIVPSESDLRLLRELASRAMNKGVA